MQGVSDVWVCPWGGASGSVRQNPEPEKGLLGQGVNVEK